MMRLKNYQIISPKQTIISIIMEMKNVKIGVGVLEEDTMDYQVYHLLDDIKLII